MFDLPAIIQTFGYAGIAVILFAESGLLIGFFLPGDSLLFPAGFLASQGHLNIWILVAVAIAAAVAGDSVGYWFGKKIGPTIFTREDSFWFRKKNVTKAHQYFEKYGSKTIVIARFIPVVRTFAPMLAGVGSMRYRTFFAYNVVGGILWAAGVSLLGFYLGAVIPNIDHYLLPIIFLIIVISVLPPVIHVMKEKENRDALKHHAKRIIKREK
jgi:membrane-associated protein